MLSTADSNSYTYVIASMLSIADIAMLSTTDSNTCINIIVLLLMLSTADSNIVINIIMLLLINYARSTSDSNI